MLKVNLIQQLAYIERVEAVPGAQVNNFFEQVRNLSILLNQRLIAVHNDIEVVVEPNCSGSSLIAEWSQKMQSNGRAIR